MRFHLIDNLGVESECGLFIPVLKKNTAIPCNNTRLMFSTEVDNQETIDIKIRAGNSWNSKNNRLLGVITLSDLPLSYRGVPFISISFFIGDNKELNVIAENMKDGTSRHFTSKIKVSNTPATSKDGSSLDDEFYLEKSRAYSLAKRMINSVKKTLSMTGNFSECDKKDVQLTIKKLETSLKTEEELEVIDSHMEELSSRSLNLHYSLFTNH